MSHKTSERSGRKVTVWKRDKISQLIKLYRQHECLWDHFVDEYRSKEHRNRAIDSICSALRITKFDFGKKIHNLRNQFNSEMKKLERRIEEAGGNPDESTMKTYRCRWEHFEALMFLRKVIEPRPGFQNSSQVPKKFRLKYESLKNEESQNINNDVKISQSTNAEDLHEYHLEESTEGDCEHLQSNDDFHEYENIEEDMTTTMEREEGYPTTSRILSPAHAAKRGTTSMSNKPTYYTCVPKTSNSAQQIQTDLIHIEDHQPLHAGSVIELTNSNPSTMNAREHNASVNTRDQWDTFGELIANEFRLLNSDISRKKLKRKIMHDLLIIGEEDDKRSKQDTL